MDDPGKEKPKIINTFNTMSTCNVLIKVLFHLKTLLAQMARVGPFAFMNLLNVSVQIALFPKTFATVGAAMGFVFIELKVHILIRHVIVIRHIFFFHLKKKQTRLIIKTKVGNYLP